MIYIYIYIHLIVMYMLVVTRMELGVICYTSLWAHTFCLPGAHNNINATVGNSS